MFKVWFSEVALTAIEESDLKTRAARPSCWSMMSLRSGRSRLACCEGKELADRLTQMHPRTKVLYTPGYTDDAIVQHGVLEPGTEFMQKPFTRAILARKVREVLDKEPSAHD